MSDDTRYPTCEHLPYPTDDPPCDDPECPGSVPVGPTKEGKQPW